LRIIRVVADLGWKVEGDRESCLPLIEQESEALIGFGKKFKVGKNYFNLSKKGNLKEAANNLYKTMREIRKRKFKSIAVVKIPNTEIGCAINDRLRKASNK